MPEIAIHPALPDRAAIEDAVSVLIAVLDALDPDPEMEDAETGNAHVDVSGRYLFDDAISQDEDCEPDDPPDGSWTEWTSRGRHKVTGDGHEQFDGLGLEDDELDEPLEDDDPAEDDNEDSCPAGDDMVASGSVLPLSSAMRDTGPGDPEDAERESIAQDVPTLRAYSLDTDLFTGKRVYLGRVNLLSSYRTNGHDVLSAETGEILNTTGWTEHPGAPV